MKKLLFTILSIYCFIYSNGQIVKHISLNYLESNFSYEYYNDSLLIISPIYDTTFNTDITKPALPYIGVNVLVMAGQECVSVSYSGNENLIMSDVDVIPNPETITTGSASQKQSEHAVIYSDSLYPTTVVEYCGTHIMDGYHIMSFRVCPYIYRTFARTLSFIDSLSIDINLTPVPANSNGFGTSEHIPEISEIVKEIIVNPDEIETFYHGNRAPSLERSNSLTNVAKYIIITNDSLEASFQPLADWKTFKGVPAKIFTTEYIDSLYPNIIDEPLRIKTFIKRCKDTLNTCYVLLGGDDTIVPIRGCYGKVQLSDNSILTHEQIPTDLYYSCFDKEFNWDRNENGIYGEQEDSIDFDPDITLTRIPVRNNNHVKVFVNRQLDYEIKTPYQKWEEKLLLSGCKYNNYYNGESDSKIYSEFYYKKYIRKYWEGSVTRFYDTYSDVGYPINSTNLQHELEKGYTFVLHASHGLAHCWLLENLDFYSNYQASLLENPLPTIISTTACNSNDFSFWSDPCLSEAFVRNPKGNIIGYIGGSAEGLSNTSNDYNNQMLSKLMAGYNGMNFGGIKHLVTCNINRENEKWVHFSTNLIGDPEMYVFCKRPQPLKQLQIKCKNDSLTICSQTGRYNVVIMSPDKTYYYNKMQICGGDTFILHDSEMPSTVDVFIGAYECIPFICSIIDGKIYIQNQTIYNDVSIIADDVIIGSNIIPFHQYGNITVAEGDIFINSPTTIYNNFKVEKNTTLTISPK